MPICEFMISHQNCILIPTITMHGYVYMRLLWNFVVSKTVRQNFWYCIVTISMCLCMQPGSESRLRHKCNCA